MLFEIFHNENLKNIVIITKIYKITSITDRKNTKIKQQIIK